MKMEDVKKWSVTYTKHVKQKRKVYQDGVLELHSSSHKVSLYDDCDKLLDSRFVKLDDVVRSGETIAFDAYLIDIGDPHGDYKPIPNLNFQGRVTKSVDKGVALHGNKFKNNPTFVGRKNNSGMNKASLGNLSPSQKIIREFKKAEAKKYCTSPNCPATTQTSSKEWQVLYTTQLSQRAKKFHDGILKLTICGLQGRQVMLYDETRRLLDSRFLKKDEIIKSGESLTFDGHLVDIGESEGDHKPVIDLNVTGRNCSAVGKAAVMHGGQLETHNSNPVEWDAMYTTQVTQKAKKYHCGIIRLASCGSYRMQASLLTEDGTTLTSRYLKLWEHISSGSSFQLLNYLVEVGEPRKYPEGEPQANVSASKDEDPKVSSLDVDNNKLSRRVPAKRPLCDGEPQNGASLSQHVDSKVRRSVADEVISCRRVPTNKPLRDAHAILSILKKPNAEEGMVTIKGASVEEYHAPQSSDFVAYDIQNQSQGQPTQGSSNKSTEVDDRNEQTSMVYNSSDEVMEPKPVCIDLSTETIVTADFDNRADTQQRNRTFGIETSIISSPNCDAKFANSSGKKPTSPIMNLSIVDADACNKSNGNVGFGEDVEVMSSKATSTLCFNQPSEEADQGITPQPCGDNTLINSTSNDEVLGPGIATSSDCVSHDNSDDERKSSEEHTNLSTTDDCPSFDLGF